LLLFWLKRDRLSVEVSRKSRKERKMETLISIQEEVRELKPTAVCVAMRELVEGGMKQYEIAAALGLKPASGPTAISEILKGKQRHLDDAYLPVFSRLYLERTGKRVDFVAMKYADQIEEKSDGGMTADQVAAERKKWLRSRKAA
jgi:predicted transcriptional regulator